MTLDFTPTFRRELKRLIKKYPSLLKDIKNLGEQVLENPTLGTSLGRNTYKIRLSITGKSGGKSGGGRVITCLKIENDTIFFMSIFDKSEKSSLSDRELTELLKEIEE